MLPSGRRLFDIWVWFSCRHGWLGSRIGWWIIWDHLIFWLVTFLCHTRAYSPFLLRFVDPPLIWMITLGFEIHIRLMTRFHCVLILQGASLESFSQIHVFWYSRDSLTKLSQARGFPHHHFSGVHVRSFVHPHGVILELSRQIGYIWCHTGAYFPPLAMKIIIPSQIYYNFHYSAKRYCICITSHYSCAFHRDELSMEHDVRVLIVPLARTIQ